MDDELRATIAGCTPAHLRLTETVAALDDEAARRPSRLPWWPAHPQLPEIKTVRADDGDGDGDGDGEPKAPSGPS